MLAKRSAILAVEMGIGKRVWDHRAGLIVHLGDKRGLVAPTLDRIFDDVYPLLTRLKELPRSDVGRFLELAAEELAEEEVGDAAALVSNGALVVRHAPIKSIRGSV